MLQQSNDLAVAYYLKEQFYDFMDSKNRDEAYKKLRKFIISVQASELDEFNACLTILANWDAIFSIHLNVHTPMDLRKV